MKLSAILIAVAIFGSTALYWYDELTRFKHIEFKPIGCCTYIYNHDTKRIMHHEGCINPIHQEDEHDE